jgi:hypothetical protein
VAISLVTGQREIGLLVATPMLPRHDMLDVENGEREIALTDVAILASLPGT